VTSRVLPTPASPCSTTTAGATGTAATTDRMAASSSSRPTSAGETACQRARAEPAVAPAGHCASAGERLPMVAHRATRRGFPTLGPVDAPG
jgi:hypothetical protein